MGSKLGFRLQGFWGLACHGLLSLAADMGSFSLEPFKVQGNKGLGCRVVGTQARR